ncbi:MAG: ABC transporter permease [Acidimicrobiia bacterium]
MMPARALFTVSIRQALPRRRTIILLLLQSAPVLVYLLATQNRTSGAAARSAVEVGAAVFFALVLPITAIMIAAGVLGNERRDLTMSFIALRPMPRSVIAAAKLFAAIAAASAVISTGAIALGVVHGIRFDEWTLLPALVIGGLVATAVYAAIYVPLGFITDRAVIIGIALLLVFENGVAAVLTGLAFLSPWRIGVSVFAGLFPDAEQILDSNAAPYSFADAAIFTIAYLVLSIGVTTLLLRTRDLT